MIRSATVSILKRATVPPRTVLYSTVQSYSTVQYIVLLYSYYRYCTVAIPIFITPHVIFYDAVYFIECAQ